MMRYLSRTFVPERAFYKKDGENKRSKNYKRSRDPPLIVSPFSCRWHASKCYMDHRKKRLSDPLIVETSQRRGNLVTHGTESAENSESTAAAIILSR